MCGWIMLKVMFYVLLFIMRDTVKWFERLNVLEKSVFVFTRIGMETFQFIKNRRNWTDLLIQSQIHALVYSTEFARGRVARFNQYFKPKFCDDIF